MVKKKYIFKKLELLYNIYLFILFRYSYFKNLNIILASKLIIYKKLLLRQKCLITKKNRSSYVICSLSRFKIKEFLTLGFIPNLKKLSW